MKSLVLTALLLIAGLVSSVPGQAQEPLRLGIVPIYDAKTTIRIFQPLAAYLQQTLNRPVKLVSAPNLKTFIDRAADDQYDVLYVHIYGYLTLAAARKISVVARGEPPFHGIAIVRTDSWLRSIPDLKGARIAAVAEESLAGFIFMRVLFQEAGMDIYRDASVSFANRIEAIPFMVINGKTDVGLFAEDTYARSSVYEATKDQLRVLARSVDIPQFPFAVRTNMEKSQLERIQSALAAIDGSSEFESNFLQELKLARLVAATDGDYADFGDYYQKVAP